MKALLDWLTGAPAGLKLNSQLTHFLGKFFQYHIFLWTGELFLLGWWWWWFLGSVLTGKTFIPVVKNQEQKACLS